MKLSMWIFADWLAEFHPQTDIKQNQFDIEAVRLFASDLTMDKHTMYIGRLRDLFKTGNDNIICVHNNDMLLLNTTELEEVLNCVLNALAYYTGWDNTMMNQLTSGGHASGSDGRVGGCAEKPGLYPGFRSAPSGPQSELQIRPGR